MRPMSKIPEEMRKQLKSFVSKTTDETLDLTINILGKYIDEKRRKKLKKKAEHEVGTKIEKAMTKAFQIGVKLREEHQLNKLETVSLKEKFYLLTDMIMKPFSPDIPKDVHAIDYLFQACEELVDSRFDFPYLRETKYFEYVQSLEMFVKKLKEENKMGKSWDVLNEFKDSKDAYTLLQTTFQRLIKYYKFLAQDFSVIKKKQLDKYLEIYDELSGQYEKFISLVVVLIEVLSTNAVPKYEDVRKRRLYENIRFTEKHGWKIFVSGFNRNIRNAIAHKTYKVDIVRRTVDFYDVNKATTLTFADVQRETRELSALLLVLPHVFISIFCSMIMCMKEALDNLSTRN